MESFSDSAKKFDTAQALVHMCQTKKLSCSMAAYNNVVNKQ